MKVLLDAARTFLLCGRQLCFFSMNVRALTEYDKDLLVDRPIVPRPSGEHIGLGLT